MRRVVDEKIMERLNGTARGKHGVWSISGLQSRSAQSEQEDR
jgi:hypothetical protein